MAIIHFSSVIYTYNFIYLTSKICRPANHLFNVLLCLIILHKDPSLLRSFAFETKMDQEDSNILLGSPLIVDEGIGIRGELRKDSFDITETSDELKRQVKIAGPLVLVSFLQYSLQMISVMFVGHLGELALSSVSMATSFAGVTGFSIMVSKPAFVLN